MKGVGASLALSRPCSPSGSTSQQETPAPSCRALTALQLYQCEHKETLLKAFQDINGSEERKQGQIARWTAFVKSRWVEESEEVRQSIQSRAAELASHAKEGRVAPRDKIEYVAQPSTIQCPSQPS